MNDEPLDEWAERRDAHRPAPGARRTVPLGEGSARGGHVDPGTPRGRLEWDGLRALLIAPRLCDSARPCCLSPRLLRRRKVGEGWETSGRRS
ncbi:DUF6087 family protein [Streptomyces atratus]|uniref:DUF6087 family protein n=1 Tax=Streptomyces atratus TaxID=1893 RepID=UPI00210B2B46|nr:DUF6087 family protein [Streptomyces atratus]